MVNNVFIDILSVVQRIILLGVMNNNSMPISRMRSRLKTDPTEYIFGQEKADQCLKDVLIYLKEWQFYYQMGHEKKISEIAHKIQMKHETLNEGHRSYAQVHSLVSTTMTLTKLRQHQYQQALDVINTEIRSNHRIDRPQFDAKTLLLKVIYLHKIEVSLWLQQINQNPQQVQEQRDKEYKKLKKIKLCPKKHQILTRRWESNLIDTLLIYQFHLIVKQIGEYDPKKMAFLFQKGLKIAIQVLGSDHHLTQILKNITKMKEKTKKILKAESLQSSVMQSRKKKNIGNKKTIQTTLYSKSPKSMNFSNITKNKVASLLSLPKKQTTITTPHLRNTSYGDTWIHKKYFLNKDPSEMKNLDKICQLYNNPEKQQQNKLASKTFHIPESISRPERWRQIIEARTQKSKGGFIVHQKSKVCQGEKADEVVKTNKNSNIDQLKKQQIVLPLQPKETQIKIHKQSGENVKVDVRQIEEQNMQINLKEFEKVKQKQHSAKEKQEKKEQIVNANNKVEMKVPETKQKQDDSSCQLI